MTGYENFKIIFITHYTELYGANRSLLNLIDGLTSKGINNITVLTPVNGKINELLKAKNIQNIVIPFKSEIHYTTQENNFIKEFSKCFYNWYVVLRYSKRLAVNKNTVIHTNTSVNFIGAYLSWWLRLPHVWHIREFGKEDYNIRYNYGYKYFQYWLNKATAIIAISKSIYTKRVQSSKASIKQIIYNGVVFSNAISSERYLNNGIATFGIIGVISKEKGQEDAIDAFVLLQKKFNNIKLLIAGQGDAEYTNNLKAKVAGYQLSENVVFSGFLENTNSFYDGIDCLLMCSRNEALGRVTIEAMSKGIPVIGYDNAGTSEIIQDGYNGLLYKNNAAELSDKMHALIQNENLRNSIVDNAFKTVKQHFTIEEYTESVIKIYKQVLG